MPDSIDSMADQFRQLREELLIAHHLQPEEFCEIIMSIQYFSTPSCSPLDCSGIL